MIIGIKSEGNNVMPLTLELSPLTSFRGKPDRSNDKRSNKRNSQNPLTFDLISFTFYLSGGKHAQSNQYRISTKFT